MRGKRRIVVSIEGRGVNVVKSFEFSGVGEINIEVVVEVPAFPKRSPLHPNALNMDDLKVGMNIRRCNKHDPRKVFHRHVGIVNGKPFQRRAKHGEQWNMGDEWMLPVVTTNYAGKLVHEDWYLADMGVVPYAADKSHRFWNDQNYTLAV